LSTLTPELSGQQLELLKEGVPKLSRLAVLGNATRPGSPQILREINLAADAFGVQLQYLEIQAPKDIEIAFRAANQERADALLVMQTPVLIHERRQVTNLAIKSRMPAIYSRPEFVEDGGLMSYATSFTDLSRRAATYVDKILKDAKPADIPVEQPKKFEFIIESQNRQADRSDDSAECAGASDPIGTPRSDSHRPILDGLQAQRCLCLWRIRI